MTNTYLTDAARQLEHAARILKLMDLWPEENWDNRKATARCLSDVRANIDAALARIASIDPYEGTAHPHDAIESVQS